jgi:group I intron endonuclease
VYGSIYLITNSVNGKVYVGQTTKTLQQRWAGHVKKARSGLRWPLLSAIRKYGPSAFTISELEGCDGPEMLNRSEAKWVAVYQCTLKSKGYNCTSGGDGGHKFTDASRAKMSASQKKVWQKDGAREQQSDRMKKHFEDPKARELASEVANRRWADPTARADQALKCKTHWESTDVREQHSALKKDQYVSNPALRVKVAEASRSRMMDPEARRRLSEMAKKQWADPEMRRRQSDRKKKLCADPAERARLLELSKKGAAARWGSKPEEAADEK